MPKKSALWCYLHNWELMLLEHLEQQKLLFKIQQASLPRPAQNSEWEIRALLHLWSPEGITATQPWAEEWSHPGWWQYHRQTSIPMTDPALGLPAVSPPAFSVPSVSSSQYHFYPLLIHCIVLLGHSLNRNSYWKCCPSFHFPLKEYIHNTPCANGNHPSWNGNLKSKTPKKYVFFCGLC